jgi:hypothetical protein
MVGGENIWITAPDGDAFADALIAVSSDGLVVVPGLP